MSADMPDPLKLLLDIEKRSHQVGSELFAPPASKPEWRGIVFRVGELTLAVSDADVSEMLTIPDVTWVPGSQTWLLGIANVRGELVPVVDLRRFLFEEPVNEDKHTRVLILHHRLVRTGLMVDEVWGMQRFLVETHTDTIPESTQPVRAYLNGSYADEAQRIAVLSVHTLVEDERFLRAAA
ncbi:MAG: chemotaxis protein CheW [Gammaproteobacteria bacterium]|nr:MAG: chemotaxis protein CheW [Gammaproteobacteria bacterium]